MKAAIYCRVSPDNQEAEGTSLQTQLEACLKYCKDKGYEVAHRFSEAYSGLSLGRPELDKLRELVRTEVIDVVVCYSLDWLTHDPRHGVIFKQEFEKHHVSLEACPKIRILGPGKTILMAKVNPQKENNVLDRAKLSPSEKKELLAKSYDLGDNSFFYNEGGVYYYKDKDGFKRRQVKGKSGMGINSGNPSQKYFDDDRRNNNETVVRHFIKEQDKEGNWEVVHDHSENVKAKRRPKKRG